MRTTSFRMAVALLMVGILSVFTVVSPATPVSAAASIHLSRTALPPGDRLTVSGSGYNAGDTVTVSTTVTVNGASRTLQATATAGSNSSFSASFVVPGGTLPARYLVTASDTHGNSNSAILNVLPLVSLQVGGPVRTFTVLAGRGFFVNGAGFGANETVAMSVQFPLYSGGTVTASGSKQTNGSGKFFERFLAVPADAKVTHVVLTATGQKSKKVAKANLAVAYRPFITLNLDNALPGDTVTVFGGGFVQNSTVRVMLTIPRPGLSTLILEKTVTTSSSGSFIETFTIPTDTTPGTYTFTAVGETGGFKATAPVTVLAPGKQSKPPKGNKLLSFRYISLWYHTVRRGSRDRVVVQARLKQHVGVWVHVFFPNGLHDDWYNTSNGNGYWAKWFSIPRNSLSRHSNQGVITFRLWKGHQTVAEYLRFTIV